MFRKTIATAVIGLSFTLAASAQLREVPTPVKEAFAAQYADASEVEYKDYLATVSVSFIQDGQKMTASYDNKGTWRQTEKEWNFDQLPEEVKDGFTKSKYADWKIEEAVVLYLPGNVVQYRVKAAKNEIQKKYVYFNKSGRLVKETITL